MQNYLDAFDEAAICVLQPLHVEMLLLEQKTVAMGKESERGSNMKLKKLLSVVLAVMMIVSMMSFGSVMAFAADSYTASADREVYGIADPIVVTVKAPASAAKVYLANESGAGLVSDRVSTPMQTAPIPGPSPLT